MSEPRRPESTRWDVQALRAFAVLAVVLYHLWPNRLPGGFVGVDVFFVVSGFLITGHLVREQAATGRIRLGAFWARRAGRLLPGAFLTLLATGAAVLLLVPSSLWGQYGRELIASTVYLQNWQLASDAVDYLASDNRPSPFQHFWSLSVEEQFYIALPVLLVLLGAVLARARRRDPVLTARLLLGTVAVLSLAWSVVQTQTAPGIAYFSTATRAWEFALGGLVATVPLAVARSRRSRAVRTGGTWLGVAGLVASVLVITPTTPYPGTAALLPVVSAALVVALGARSGLDVVGRTPPVAFVGRTSYAVYLWHWPAVVLLPIVLGHPLGTASKVAVLVGALVLAAASTLLVEEPLRARVRSARVRPRRVAVLGVVASVAVVGLGVGTLAAVQVQQVQAAAFAERLTRGDVDCFGAAARIGSDDPCVNPRLADVRVPAPAAAQHDDANSGDCWSNTTADFNVCALGPRTGYRKHLLAVGDSHNNALMTAYRAIAEREHWRIDVAGHIGCYFTTAVQQAPTQGYTDSCQGWKQNAVDWVRQHDDELDAVVVTHAATKSPVIVPDGSSNDATVVDGLVGAWRAATDAGVPVIAIRDNPTARDDVIACLAQMQGPTTGACDLPRDQALAAFDGSEQAVAAVGDRARYVDMTDWYCDRTTCPAVIGGVVTHRDPTHLTATFATTLAPALGDRLSSALASLER